MLLGLVVGITGMILAIEDVQKEDDVALVVPQEQPAAPPIWALIGTTELFDLRHRAEFTKGAFWEQVNRMREKHMENLRLLKDWDFWGTATNIGSVMVTGTSLATAWLSKTHTLPRALRPIPTALYSLIVVTITTYTSHVCTRPLAFPSRSLF